ncbi:MAG: hypothetical protein ACI3X6_06240 [Alloprevotella sp.]
MRQTFDAPVLYISIKANSIFQENSHFVSKKAGNAFANSKQKHNFAPQNGGNAYINAAR